MAQFNDGGKWRKATGAAFDRVMKEGRTERRLQASERTMEKARDRSAKIRALRQEKDSRDYRASVKKIIRDLGLGPGGKAWGRMFHVRVPKAPGQTGKAKQQRSIRPSSRRVGLPKYRKAIRDLKGRVAVYVQMSYLGLKSKSWRPGLAADHAKYCQREDALEEADVQLAKPISNVAETPGECVAMWNAVEPVEQGYRANAKVQFRAVIALPHEFSPQQRREVLQDIGDQTFGRYGLGWMAFGHLPEEKGDERNTHGHLLATLRPVVRLGDHEWAISEEKLTEPFTPEGMKRMRAIMTAVINRHCRKAGLEERYSHQSYQERGLDAFRTEKIGPARMAAYEAGEDVALIERNHARIAANEASVEAQSLRAELELREALVAALKKAASVAESAQRFIELRKRVVAVQQKMERVIAMKRSVYGKPRIGLSDAMEGIAQRVAAAGSTKSSLPLSEGIREAVDAIAERAKAYANRDASHLVKRLPRKTDRLLRPGVERIIAANEALASTAPKPARTIRLGVRESIETINNSTTMALRATRSRPDIKPDIRAQIVQISARIRTLRSLVPQPFKRLAPDSARDIDEPRPVIATGASKATPGRIELSPKGQLLAIIQRVSNLIGAAKPRSSDTETAAALFNILNMVGNASTRQVPEPTTVTSSSRAFVARVLEQVTKSRLGDAANPTSEIEAHRENRPSQSLIDCHTALEADHVEEKFETAGAPSPPGTEGLPEVRAQAAREEIAEPYPTEIETRPLVVRLASFAATMGQKPTGLILGDDGFIYPLLARADSWGLSKADLATETARRQLLPLYVEQELRLESLETEMKWHVKKPSELSESDMFCTKKLSKPAVETHDTYRHSWLMREAIQRVRREAWLRQGVESRKERMEKAGIDWRGIRRVSRGLGHPGILGRQRDNSLGL